MTVEEIANRCSQYLWLHVLEIQEESPTTKVIVLATPSGVACFSVTVQKHGTDDWRFMGLRFDLEDHMTELREVADG
jgi:hypothetical protein